MKTNRSMYEAVIAQRDEALRLRGTRRHKTIAVCGAICIAAALFVIAGIVLPKRELPHEAGTEQAGTADLVTEQPEAATTEPLTRKADLFTRESVRYSEIAADGAPCAAPPGSNSTADIASFREEMLKNADLIVEGTVTETYVKQYDFTVEAPGKFENADGVMRIRYTPNALVTTLRVERVYYAKDKFSVGCTVTFEDEILGLEGCFGYRAGVAYVIALRLLTEDANKPIEAYLSEDERLVEGEPFRDSQYCSLYPYQPPVEIAATGDYILPDTWASLTCGTAVPVTMDLSEYCGWTQTNAVFYTDRMRLVPAAEFRSSLQALLQRLELLR